MKNRNKLETAIEREVFKMVRSIKDHTRDFTVLKMRREGTAVDNETMTKVLEVVDEAIMAGFHVNVDRLMKGIDPSLTEFSDEENPLPPSAE